MNHFCTISTFSHLYKVYALADSLRDQESDFVLHVLVTDSGEDFKSENCKFWGLKDLKNSSLATSIINKYLKYPDKLRWSLKPVFISSIIEEMAEKVVYVDNDQFFYSDYTFLFNLLDEYSFLLTPHYYKHNPGREQNWLEANFRVGLYNAGFIGASKKAAHTLQWWAECCEYRCEKNSFRGLFDDQKYLDLIPVIDESAHVVRHKGCNLAGWNREYCERNEVEGVLRIAGTFPVVFIHFNSFTILEIIEGRDPMLLPYWNKYIDALRKHKHDLRHEELYKRPSLLEKLKYNIWKMITELGI